MLYFFALEISGEPAQFFEEISRSLAEDLSLFPLHKRVPLHITLKAPFRHDSPDSLTSTLFSVARDHAPFSLKLSKLGSFGRETLYAAPEESRDLTALDLDLRQRLKELPDIEWKGYERGPKRTFHASLARHIPSEAFSEAESFILGRFPRDGWSVTVSEVTLFSSPDGRRWNPDTVALLGSSHGKV